MRSLSRRVWCESYYREIGERHLLGSQVLRRSCCWLQLLLIEYQYNLSTGGMDTQANVSLLRGPPIEYSYLNRALVHWCLQPAVMNRSPNSTTTSIVPQPTFTMFGTQASIYTRNTKETSAETVLPVSFCRTPRLTQRLIATRTPNEVCSSQLLKLSCSFMKKARLFKMGLYGAFDILFCHCSAWNLCFALACGNVWQLLHINVHTKTHLCTLHQFNPLLNRGRLGVLYLTV